MNTDTPPDKSMRPQTAPEAQHTRNIRNAKNNYKPLKKEDMKTKKKVLFVSLLLLWITAGITGCNKDDDQIWEIAPDGKQAVIEQKINGLAFKFCLLNEKGEPATVFKEGENFRFYFLLNNVTQDDISVSTDFITGDFYRVYQSNNTNRGTPWTGIWCEFSKKPTEMKISPLTTRKLSCPWKLTNETRPDYPFCMSGSRETLPKGDYYTTIHTKFKYATHKEQFTENIYFKINFKIE